MQNTSKKSKSTTWYLPAFLSVLLLVCGTQLVACTYVVGKLPPAFGTATITPASSSSSSSDQESQIAQAVFDAINNDRAAAGLSALHRDTQLVASAHQHNIAMMNANQLEHQVSGEAGLGDRETQQGVTWVLAEENIGYTTEMTQDGALSLHRAMMAEKPPDDGHRVNILNAQVNQLGVDILFDSTNNKLWLTEDFAQIT